MNHKDNSHATVDHDSIWHTFYGIVMVNFTLVTCSSHSIRLVSTTFSNKSTILTLCLICLLTVCYIHLITCLSDQTLDSFLSPPIESWWNWGARWAWQLPTENLHVPSARHDWDYHRSTARGQRCAKPVESMLPPVWTYICPRPQVSLKTGVYFWDISEALCGIGPHAS